MILEHKRSRCLFCFIYTVIACIVLFIVSFHLGLPDDYSFVWIFTPFILGFLNELVWDSDNHGQDFSRIKTFLCVFLLLVSFVIASLCFYIVFGAIVLVDEAVEANPAVISLFYLPFFMNSAIAGLFFYGRDAEWDEKHLYPFIPLGSFIVGFILFSLIFAITGDTYRMVAAIISLIVSVFPYLAFISFFY